MDAKPSRARRATGRASLGLYRFAVRARARALSAACGGAFAAFGTGSTLQPPVRV
jgi:hypothetical protein